MPEFMFPFGMAEPPSEEQVAEAQAEQDRQRMKNEDFSNRMRRLLAEELTLDQAAVLHAMFHHVADSGRPSDVANWYEGIIAGTMFTRTVRTTDSTAEEDLAPSA